MHCFLYIGETRRFDRSSVPNYHILGALNSGHPLLVPARGFTHCSNVVQKHDGHLESTDCCWFIRENRKSEFSWNFPRIILKFSKNFPGIFPSVSLESSWIFLGGVRTMYHMPIFAPPWGDQRWHRWPSCSPWRDTLRTSEARRQGRLEAPRGLGPASGRR